MSENDQTVTLLAALSAGDCYLSADSAAVVLGMTTADGKPNRRGFLERVACRGSFPKPLAIGNEKKWKKSEVLQWADDERRISSRAA